MGVTDSQGVVFYGNRLHLGAEQLKTLKAVEGVSPVMERSHEPSLFPSGSEEGTELKTRTLGF